MITLHTLKPSERRYRPKRVGRGNASGKGTTAARGTKGQRARTGGRNKLVRRGLKRLIERTPKVRGFRSRRPVLQTVSIQKIDRVLKDGALVNARSLKQAGLVASAAAGVKILGAGPLHKKFTVHVDHVTKQATEQITKAGGTVKVPKPSQNSSKE